MCSVYLNSNDVQLSLTCRTVMMIFTKIYTHFLMEQEKKGEDGLFFKFYSITFQEHYTGLDVTFSLQE